MKVKVARGIPVSYEVVTGFRGLLKITMSKLTAVAKKKCRLRELIRYMFYSVQTESDYCI